MNGHVQELVPLREFRVLFAQWCKKSKKWMRGTDKFVSLNSEIAALECKNKYPKSVCIHCKDMTQN